MKLIKTNITDGPKILKTKIFKDRRGFLKETFQNKIIKKISHLM
jgi:dTDP-4-dehydrorhamnose 3,5-epimerase